MSGNNTDFASKRIRDKRGTQIAGALIILGYLTYGIPNAMLVQPLVTATDPVAAIATDGTQLTLGALGMAINSAAVIGIGLFLYPILKRYSESIALGYVVTRTFESIAMIVGIIGLLVLVPVSEAAVQGSAADAAAIGALTALVVQGNEMAYRVAMIGLSIGSLPFCYLLYRSKLVPRALSVLGVIGYLALLTMMVVDAIGVGVGPILYALYVPGMGFEIGLACWLLVRGVDTSAKNSEQSPVLDGEPVE